MQGGGSGVVTKSSGMGFRNGREGLARVTARAAEWLWPKAAQGRRRAGKAKWTRQVASGVLKALLTAPWIANRTLPSVLTCRSHHISTSHPHHIQKLVKCSNGEALRVILDHTRVIFPDIIFCKEASNSLPLNIRQDSIKIRFAQKKWIMLGTAAVAEFQI